MSWCWCATEQSLAPAMQAGPRRWHSWAMDVTDDFTAPHQYLNTASMGLPPRTTQQALRTSHQDWAHGDRSEERRVGKEWRARWARDDEKKKKRQARTTMKCKNRTMRGYNAK